MPVRRRQSSEYHAEEAIFVKDGDPVSFFFHPSVREGLDILKQEITRHGGWVCKDERRADVILVDEEADIEHIRRRYYRSHLLWQQRVFVESRGFVPRCITARRYEHIPPARQGMPGVRQGVVRKRVSYSKEDDENLAYYIATVIPDVEDGGRMGNALYMTLTEELAREPEYTWAKRHTWHSWRERYKMHADIFDPKIDAYAERLKEVSHGFGHDPRSRRYKRGRLIRGARRMEEEEEDEDEDEVEVESDQEFEQRQVGGTRAKGLDMQVPGGVPQAHEEGPENIPEHGGGPTEQPLRTRTRRRDDPDTSQREILSGESPHKRQRVAYQVAPSQSRAPLVEKGRRASDYDHLSRNSIENGRTPREEGNIFVQGTHDGTANLVIDQMPELYKLPDGSPEHEFTETQTDGRPATRQTSPVGIHYQNTSHARITAQVAGPMSSQATLVAQPLRAPRRPLSHRGRAQREENLDANETVPATSTERGPQVESTQRPGRSLGRQPPAPPSDAPYRNTRARSRSVDLPPQSAPPSKGQRVVSAKGKEKAKELEEVPEEDAEWSMDKGSDLPVQISEKAVERRGQPISGSLRLGPNFNIRESSKNEGEGEKLSVDVQKSSYLPNTLQEENDVENILEPSSLFTDNEDEGLSNEISNRGEQEFSVRSSSEEPSDSDDAATHRMLRKTPLKVKSEFDEDEERNEERLKRMASVGFRIKRRSHLPSTTASALKKPAAVTARSSTTRVPHRGVQAPFPSPGTKARTAYETRLRERRGK